MRAGPVPLYAAHLEKGTGTFLRRELRFGMTGVAAALGLRKRGSRSQLSKKCLPLFERPYSAGAKRSDLSQRNSASASTVVNADETV